MFAVSSILGRGHVDHELSLQKAPFSLCLHSSEDENFKMLWSPQKLLRPLTASVLKLKSLRCRGFFFFSSAVHQRRTAAFYFQGSSDLCHVAMFWSHPAIREWWMTWLWRRGPAWTSSSAPACWEIWVWPGGGLLFVSPRSLLPAPGSPGTQRPQWLAERKPVYFAWAAQEPTCLDLPLYIYSILYLNVFLIMSAFMQAVLIH